jgi:hypothetical protein
MKRKLKMNKLAKITIISATAIAATLSSFAPSYADDYWRHRHHRHHDDSGRAVAAGVAGLAAGVILSNALNQPRYVNRDYLEGPVGAPPPPAYEPDYYPVSPRRYSAPEANLEPWTSAWYEYCSDRYRSFNARTGTYMGYDGRSHFCEAGG